MSDRITEKNLDGLIKRINEATGNAIEPYTKNGEGEFKSNPGNYHLSWAYGRISCEQMCNEGGGVRRIFGSGTKRELYAELSAFLSGLAK